VPVTIIHYLLFATITIIDVFIEKIKGDGAREMLET
jgi:hypothetical protein